MKKYVVTCLFVLIVSISVGSDALGCPTCKDGLQAADSEGANIARDIFIAFF